MTTDEPEPRDAGGAPGERPGDAGPEVALLDLDGVVVAVNDAWVRFCVDNGGDPDRSGPGVSYLDVCDAAGGDVAAARVATAIRRAVRGGLPVAERLEMPCDSPVARATVEVYVSSRFADDGTCVGALVTVRPVDVPVPRGAPRRGREPGLQGDAAASLLEASPDGVVVVAASGRILYVNRELEALSGYSREELVGAPAELLVPGPLRARHDGLRREYARAPTRRPLGHAGPLQLERRDGSMLPVEVALGTATVDGHPVTLAAVRDITARRELEERLRLVADMLDATTDAVAVVDIETGRRIYANRALLTRTGFAPEELDEVPVGSPATDADAARLAQAVSAVVSGDREAVSVDLDMRSRDGTVLPTEMRIAFRPGASRPDDNGPRARGHLILTGRDIGDRLAAQERVRRSEEAFRAAFDQAPTGMVVSRLDAAGNRRIVRANPAMGAILGVPADELAGHDFTEFTYPDDEPVDREAAVEMTTGGRRVYERQKRYRRPDGSTVRVEFRSVAVDLPADTFGGPGDGTSPTVAVLAHVVDVTARHEADRRRLQRSAAAEVVAEVVTGVLAGQPVAVTHQQVVDGAARVFDAENVALLLPAAGTGFTVVAAHGGTAAAVKAGRLPRDDRAAERLLLLGTTTTFAEPPVDVPPEVRRRLGPGASTRFRTSADDVGLLLVARRVGGTPFTDDEARLLAGLADQVALAVALDRERVDRERLDLLEERHQLARDLHDTVIQDVIAVGMQLEASGPPPGSPQRVRHDALVEQLDATIRRLRAAVLGLGAPPAAPATTSEVIRSVVADAGRILPRAPSLHLGGLVDALPEGIADDLVAVLREALSNVARHANATRADVRVTVTGTRVRLVVEDDGDGVDPTRPAGHGLANGRHRASTHDGTMTLTRRRPRGTRLTWTGRVRQP